MPSRPSGLSSRRAPGGGHGSDRALRGESDWPDDVPASAAASGKVGGRCCRTTRPSSRRPTAVRLQTNCPRRSRGNCSTDGASWCGSCGRGSRSTCRGATSCGRSDGSRHAALHSVADSWPGCPASNTLCPRPPSCWPRSGGHRHDAAGDRGVGGGPAQSHRHGPPRPESPGRPPQARPLSRWRPGGRRPRCPERCNTLGRQRRHRLRSADGLNDSGYGSPGGEVEHARTTVDLNADVGEGTESDASEVDKVSRDNRARRADVASLSGSLRR